jgi:hypothetical protein
MRKKLWVPIFGMLLLCGCDYVLYQALHPGEEGPPPPYINAAWASSIARPGDIWKVYLKATAPVGEMKAIFSTIEQPGYGVYPVSITMIKPENRKAFDGYIYLDTGATAGDVNILNFVNLTLRVRIQDMANHFSDEEIFPLSLESGKRQFSSPLHIFKENDLGPILIRLEHHHASS